MVMSAQKSGTGWFEAGFQITTMVRRGSSFGGCTSGLNPSSETQMTPERVMVTLLVSKQTSTWCFHAVLHQPKMRRCAYSYARYRFRYSSGDGTAFKKKQEVLLIPVFRTELGTPVWIAVPSKRNTQTIFSNFYFSFLTGTRDKKAWIDLNQH